MAEPTKAEQTLLSLTGWCGDIPVVGTELVIGRAEGCEGRIALGHISARHCKLLPQADGSLLVKDLSKNGTFVNGKVIGRERYEVLKNGDTLSLTPPGEQKVESVAFVYHNSRVCNDRASVFNKGLAGSNITLVNKLGQGAFGEVWLVVSENKRRALKVVRKSQSNARLYDEVKVMDKLRHPHIVGIHQVFATPTHVMMTIDLAEGGDLDGLLRMTGRLSESDSKSLLVQVLNALAYLHEARVIHRDLKPENILLKMPLASKAVPHLLLTDFGLSKSVDLAPATTICGTPYYMAPEMVKADVSGAKQSYDERVDVWSAGILLYRFLHGKVPWPSGLRPSQLGGMILLAAKHQPALSFDPTVSVSPECRRFFDQLVIEQSHRLSAKDALKDEWFDEARRRVANSILWDESQTQGLAALEDIVPDRFLVATPASSSPALQSKASPGKRTRNESDEGSGKRVRTSGSTDDVGSG